MRKLFFVCLFAMLGSVPAWAGVEVRVDISEQKMYIAVDGTQQYVWSVSGPRTGLRVPYGTYRPTFLDRHHRSSRYNNAPMPYSIFFTGNYAIHGTTEVAQLGHPASHGCIRLHPDNAAALFALVKKAGLGNTRISIVH